MTKTTVLYHANCFDGAFSAAVAKDHFGDSATYVPVSYDTPLTDFTSQRLYFLDVVYKEDDMRALLDKGNEIHVIDHHRDNVLPISHLPFASISYDANESGASLTFKRLNPDKDIPLAIAHARDYDLWKFELDNTKAFIAHQGTLPLDVNAYQDLLKLDGSAYKQFVAVGHSILAYKMNLVSQIASNAAKVRLKGFNGWILNGPSELASELGNEVAQRKNSSFAMIWNERPDGKIKVSFRSCDGNAPLQIAKLLGGGGHDRAAGVVMEKAKFNRLVSAAKRSFNATTSHIQCCDHH